MQPSEKVYALLLDTMSIQKYVFGSNRLKDNIGASFLVESIFQKTLLDALNSVIPQCAPDDDILTKWESGEQVASICQENSPPHFEVGFIGGGNALLFFHGEDAENNAKSLVRAWTKDLLVKAPGLQTAVAMETASCNCLSDGEKFKEFKGRMFGKRLVASKNTFFPNTILPKHGITADCPISGFSAELYAPSEDNRFISAVSKAKLDAADEAKSVIQKRYEDILGENYTFTTNLEKLGQTEGDSHIAVVHIDGNSMAKRFRDAGDLNATRELSKSVRQATDEAYRKLLCHIINNLMAHLQQKESEFAIKEEQGKKILPIRTIVLGGDDITFVTDGRLGVHLAEKFINFFVEQEVSDQKPLSACGGIAIVKTKYPFYRAYELAEQLCAQAKTVAREKNLRKNDKSLSSWIDYHISYGGFSGSIAEIRHKHFRTSDKGYSLIFGPYLVCGGDGEEDEQHISRLKEGIRIFKDSHQWPRSKVKDLRSALTQDEGSEAKAFYKSLMARGLSLPISNYQREVWVNSKTPYFDMIELLDFYPDFCLSEKQSLGRGDRENDGTKN